MTSTNEDYVQHFRAVLDHWRDRVVPAVLGINDPQDCRRIMQVEMERALAELGIEGPDDDCAQRAQRARGTGPLTAQAWSVHLPAMSPRTYQLSTHDRRRVALVSLCDEKTLRRYFTGKPVREATVSRIRAAMAQLGIKGCPQHLRGTESSS